MSRRDGIDIKSIIDEYKAFKDIENKAKKDASPLAEQIKEYALKNGLDKIKSDNWQANISVTPKQDFNELQAIEIIKKNLGGELLASVIKTKEYIDEDALEKAIYNGDIDAKLLSPCTIEKEPTVKLTIGKIK